MAYRLEIDHAKRFVHVRFEGVTTLQDIEAYLDEVVVQGAMPYRKLLDSRKAIAQYDDADVMAMGARISAYEAFEPRGPVAVVLVSDGQLLVTERVHNLGGAKRPAKIFFSESQARKWLAEQPEA
jgi:hypothetical protein